MAKFKFIILGNQDELNGNPIGYTRVIKQQWRADASRYMRWQEYVRFSFYSAGFNSSIVPHGKNSKPFGRDDKNKYAVSMKVLWKNNQHADLDNVLKGVIDSLFENDSRVVDIAAISEVSDKKAGRVDVEISIVK